jgi:hypothetical protein
VILVSKHRIAGAGSQVATYGRDGMTPDPAGGVGQEGDDTTRVPDDLFEVCTVLADGKLSNPIWKQQFAGGLDTPQLGLFMKFRDAVERAYPSQPAAKQTTKP